MEFSINSVRYLYSRPKSPYARWMTTGPRLLRYSITGVSLKLKSLCCAQRAMFSKSMNTASWFLTEFCSVILVLTGVSPCYHGVCGRAER